MMLRALRQHGRIAGELARVGVVRKAQFKLEFWCQVLMDCLWYATHIGVVETLYLHTDAIAGWRRDEFRVLLGFLFVSDGFMMAWLSQMFRFGRDVKDGALDPFRVRPVATFFLYGFQLFSLEGCLNLAIALGYLGYAVGLAAGFSLPTLAATLLGIALSCWARVAIVALFSVFELWLLGSDFSRFMQDVFYSALDRPVDIFGARVRLFLLYVIPIGALTQLPAAIVLGHYSALETAAVCGWLALFGALVFALWNRSLNRYESARG